MISVVIPLYNKEKQIRKTLQSVLTQTFQDFEIVVVNDGSTDNSAIEVEKVKDPRIRLIHQHNAGVSAARNKGIEKARYELIAFLDADDEWKSNFLQTLYKLQIQYPQCGMYATSYINKTASGKENIITLNKLPFEKEGILSNYFEVAACSHPPICSISVMIKKQPLKAINGFPSHVKSGEDLITWAKLSTITQIAYSTEPLAIYNMGEGYILTNTPPRTQDEGDPVGNELKILLSKTSEKTRKDLKKYISLWHKMRASTDIRYNFKKKAIKECFLSLKYNPMNRKVYLFLIISILPFCIKKYIISHYI